MSNSNDLPYTHPVVSGVALRRRVEALRRRDQEIKSRLAEPLKQLWQPERALVGGAAPSVFEALQVRFPNFSHVIEYWLLCATVSTKTAQPFQSQPVLLIGAPGLGKTYFAAETSRMLGLDYFEINLSTVTGGFVLNGNSLQWHEACPGYIAKSIAKSRIANPVLMMDEIDKASNEGRHGVMGGFYPLLEPHTAKRYRDECLELELDASLVNWICTANYPKNIPAPLLSRMKRFLIEQPQPQHMPDVLRSIYQHILSSSAIGKLLNPELPDATMVRLERCSPRLARMALEDACAKAVLRDGDTVLPEDLNIPESKPPKQPAKEPPKKPPFGFIPGGQS